MRNAVLPENILTVQIQIKTGKGWVTSNKIGQTNPPPHLSMVRDGLGSRGSRGSQICYLRG